MEENAANRDLLLILAGLLTLPFALATLVLLYVFLLWSSVGFSTRVLIWSADIASFIVAPATLWIGFSTITLGIALRLIRNASPAFSLALSINSFVLFSFAFWLFAFAVNNAAAQFGIIVLYFVTLAVASLPPFLHWWKTREILSI